MSILLLKIFLAPVIITLCTLAGRKYGHSVGGIIVGLPLTSGPVALILALEQGKAFVEEFSNGILFGIILVGFFDVIYAYASKKFHWAICSLVGWVVYGVAAYFLQSVSFPIIWTFGIVIFSLLILIYFFPKHQEEQLIIKMPTWDIPVRVCVATGLIFFLTYLSNHISAHLSGIVSTFPVYSTIFAASTHYHYGSNAAIRLLRGILIGSFSFVAFFLVLGTTIADFGMVFSFSMAIAAALLVQLLRVKAVKFTCG